MDDRVLHGWSVDVEDWFHVLEYAGAPAIDQWPLQQSRVEAATLRMLDLLDLYGHRATFFCLGWIAVHHPQVIAEIARRGHEIGSHGHSHALVSSLSRDAFARDLDASLEALHRACGQTVKAFRAPGFSIGDEQTWAFGILASRGIDLDASLFLADRAHGGILLRRERPFELVLAGGQRILEVPIIPLQLAGRSLPFSGGGYLRVLPQPLLMAAFSAFERKGLAVAAYVHPRELDPDQPRLDLPWRRQWKYYVGLEGTVGKIESLFRAYRFAGLRAMAQARPLDPPLQVGQPPADEAA